VSERLFDFDPLTGLKTTFRYNEENDSFALTYSQDIDPILDANKADQAEGHDKRGDMWHAARIPSASNMSGWSSTASTCGTRTTRKASSAS
jgi:hypothetical protein